MLTHTLNCFFFPKKFKCNLLEEVGAEHRAWIEQKYAV